LLLATTLARAAPGAALDERVAAVREFNRFYTNVIGLLREGLLQTPYTLTDARVLFELGRLDSTEAAELRRVLDIDPGYLSRILVRFESDGLLTRRRSKSDARRRVIRLTARGRKVVETLDARSAAQVGKLISSLAQEDQRRLVGAMATIRRILEDREATASFVLRPPRPGDLGWVVQRHGSLYAEEYGWGESFEALVAAVVAEFAARRDTRHERAWIAEMDGEPAGCVFCMRKEKNVAQLRLLLVEEAARGMGIGSRLVEECVRFARQAGYEQLMLWTNDVLRSARRIYEAAGFKLVEENPHRDFGPEAVGQTFELSLKQV
jgi:DNA-binding MarR family transcriptional regulator/GNAT superfamily N-acetyltransferase